jgi:4-carboxymuconolactone decarboxylase
VYAGAPLRPSRALGARLAVPEPSGKGDVMQRPQRVRIPPAPVDTAAITTAMNANNVRRTLATNAIVAQGLAAFGQAVLNGGSIPPRRRELVILRMGWNCQSRYEFGQHTLMGRSVGLTDAEILHLTRPLETWPWSPEDRALLQMVDDLHGDDCVGDAAWQDLETHFSHHEILEYMAATLFYRMISGLLNSCGVELDDGVPGWPVVAAP